MGDIRRVCPHVHHLINLFHRFVTQSILLGGDFDTRLGDVQQAIACCQDAGDRDAGQHRYEHLKSHPTLLRSGMHTCTCRPALTAVAPLPMDCHMRASFRSGTERAGAAVWRDALARCEVPTAREAALHGEMTFYSRDAASRPAWPAQGVRARQHHRLRAGKQHRLAKCAGEMIV